VVEKENFFCLSLRCYVGLRVSGGPHLSEKSRREAPRVSTFSQLKQRLQHQINAFTQNFFDIATRYYPSV
jgi:hypothetical protein